MILLDFRENRIGEGLSFVSHRKCPEGPWAYEQGPTLDSRGGSNAANRSISQVLPGPPVLLQIESLNRVKRVAFYWRIEYSIIQMAKTVIPAPTTSVLQVRLYNGLRVEIIKLARAQRQSESRMAKFLLEEALEARGVKFEKEK